MQADTPCYWFCHDKLLISKQAALPLTWGMLQINFPAEALKTAWLMQTHAGELIYVIDAPASYRVSQDFELTPIKPIYKTATPQIASHIAQAYQRVYFNRTHQFCRMCAHPLAYCDKEWAKSCPSCQHVFYPQLSPVVMVLIHHQGKILLAHHRELKLYSVIAGFVESGETLEEAAKREVREEVGLEIKSLRYFASQSWPFPHALIVAFQAEYAAGDICVDGEEISGADWFEPDNLPRIPTPGSLASELIMAFLAQYTQHNLQKSQ